MLLEFDRLPPGVDLELLLPSVYDSGYGELVSRILGLGESEKVSLKGEVVEREISSDPNLL